MSMLIRIRKIQTVALVRRLGGPVEFVEDYPVPTPGQDEVLAKVLYVGVCQSDLHTKSGTAAGPDGQPITAIKLPHIGGHEGIACIVALGPGLAHRDPTIKLGSLVGVRFASRICRRCEFYLAGKEQYCIAATNHLHHEDGAFQEYIALDAGYLTILPEECGREDLKRVMGPVLCAGVTAYKAVLNCDTKIGDWLVVIGAGGGLGQFAVHYGLAQGVRVIGVDAGKTKRDFVTSLGAKFVDFAETTNPVDEVVKIINGGAHAIVVTAGNSKAYAAAANMLRTEGTLAACGIPPGGGKMETTMATIAIKRLKIKGNLVGNLKECLEAVSQVTMGLVKPRVAIRPFRDLPAVYEELERGEIAGRVVLKVGDDPLTQLKSKI